MKKWAYVLIVLGAAQWGLIGLFVQILYAHGLNPIQVVAVRVITAATILVLYTLARSPRELRIKFGDLKYFIGTGILSIVFFNWAFFTAIQETSISVAAALLYTGPAFVTILSRFIFKEYFTPQKITALVMTLAGCFLVVGFLPELRTNISLYGFLVGLGSGLGYALYTVFGKMASKRYGSLTITTYTFVVASIALLPVSGLPLKTFTDTTTLLYSLGLGFFPTVLAYLLYTYGLSRVESSRAAITTTIEPVVATIVGVTVFGDVLSIWQVIGIVLILSAVVLVQQGKSKAAE